MSRNHCLVSQPIDEHATFAEKLVYADLLRDSDVPDELAATATKVLVGKRRHYNMGLEPPET